MSVGLDTLPPPPSPTPGALGGVINKVKRCGEIVRKFVAAVYDRIVHQDSVRSLKLQLLPWFCQALLTDSSAND